MSKTTNFKSLRLASDSNVAWSGMARAPLLESMAAGGFTGFMLPRLVRLGDVVDAVAVDVGWVGDHVLLHPVAFSGQRCHVLGERRRAGGAPSHRNRNLHGRVCVNHV